MGGTAAAAPGGRGVLGLAGARLALAVACLLPWLGLPLADTVPVAACVACAYVLAIPVTMPLREGRRWGRWAPVVFTADVLLVTGLVYVSGGIGSDLVLLYPLIIPAAGLTAAPRRAVQMTIGSVLAFLGLAALLVNGVLRPAPPAAAVTPDMALLRMVTLRFAAIVAGGAAAVFIARRSLSVNRNAGQMRQLAEIAFHHVCAGLLVLDHRNRILMANERASQLLGRPAADLRDQPLAALTAAAPPPETGAPATPHLRRADGTVFPVAQETVRLILPADILPDGAGTGLLPVGIMVFNDLTPLLQRQHAARVADTLRVMNHAAAEIAHEIRNPLSAISGAVQLINNLEQAAASGELHCADRLARAKPELIAHILAETERVNHTIEKFINTTEFTPATLARQFAPLPGGAAEPAPP